MKKVMTITAVLLLSSWIAGPGYWGSKISLAAESATPPAASQTVPGTIGPDGKPMTKEEYEKALKARMEARSDVTKERLEGRQSKWKKDSQADGAGDSGKVSK